VNNLVSIFSLEAFSLIRNQWYTKYSGLKVFHIFMASTKFFINRLKTKRIQKQFFTPIAKQFENFISFFWHSTHTSLCLKMMLLATLNKRL